jgi:succinyl-CoA synthetase beta subunit/citryl-CoA synthetase large subunit
MARVLENVGKDLLKENGVPAPEFMVAATSDEARSAAQKIGCPVVIKALVTAGKRGKAGAVRFAENPDAAAKTAEAILAMTVYNFPVKRVLVERKLDISQELYVSITYDPVQMAPVIITSTAGGIDIEEIAAARPEKILKYHVNMLTGFNLYEAKEIWSDLGLKGSVLQKATTLLWRLYQLFVKYDCTVIEINPLALTADADLIAAAILMGVDDDALYRQPYFSEKVEAGSDRAWRPLTVLEKKMIEVDKTEAYRGTARYTEMEGGNIGFFCGGGGGSLLSYDALLRFGGKPANYTEFGGNPPEAKVKGLVKGVLSKPGVKGFYMNLNITNNTQTDIVAKGIIGAFKDLNIDPEKFPAVLRLAGVHDTEARRLCTAAGLEYHGDDITMEDTARIIVEKMRKAFPQETD